MGGERRRGGKGGCTVHVVMNSRSLDYYEPLDEGGGGICNWSALFSPWEAGEAGEGERNCSILFRPLAAKRGGGALEAQCFVSPLKPQEKKGGRGGDGTDCFFSAKDVFRFGMDAAIQLSA